MYLTDYHIHTIFSFDSTEDPDAVCREAIQRGLSEIAFTEHMDVHPDRDKTTEQYYFAHETERLKRINRLKREYEGRLVIRYGLEMGQPHRDAEFSRGFLAARDFDVVLGSVHYTTSDRELLHIPYRDFTEADDVIRDYYAHVYQMLNFPGFDVIAHICHPLRVMDRFLDTPSFMRYFDLIEPILRKGAEQGKALEISTKGLRFWMRALEPELPILRAFKRFGGEYITIGTDSHDFSSVGDGTREACAYAREADFNYVTTFDNHRPILRPIAD